MNDAFQYTVKGNYVYKNEELNHVEFGKNRVILMTYSGGLQEEVPSFGVTVIYMRIETERLETVEVGTVVVSGVEEKVIYSIATKLIQDKDAYDVMVHAVNPYGDGKASQRIVKSIVD